MDTTKILADLKKRPGFYRKRGHGAGAQRRRARVGPGRPCAREIHAKVPHDRAKMDAICREMEQQPGIFCIHAEAVEGELKPGDDVLFLVVAGDIREHVEGDARNLDRIKAEAVIKQEFTE